MAEITLVTGIFSLLTAVAVLWLNPRRMANQAFSIVSIIQAAWLACVYMAMEKGSKGALTNFLELEYWLRANAAVVAFLPWTLAIMKDAIIDQRRWISIMRPSGWMLTTIGMVTLCYQDSFIVSDADGDFGRGNAYWFYSALAVGCYFICVLGIYRELPRLRGIRRLELQVLGTTATIGALVIASFNTLGNILEFRSLNRSTVVWVFATYAIMACAFIFQRIFNARQIFTIVAQRAALFCIFCFGIILIPQLVDEKVLRTPVQVTAIFACGVGVIWLDRKSKKWLSIDEETITANARAGIIRLASGENTMEKIKHNASRYLSDHFKSPHVDIQITEHIDKSKIWVEFSNTLAYQTLCRAGWATPESLHRQRSSPESIEIRAFMLKHSLAVIVAVPEGSSTPSLVVALGTKNNDTPFTYPEVTRLQNIAELMDNILTRSQLTVQAALQAKMEHLAMMSRGLAHDLKNLITPIGSYLLYTAPHHPRGTLEAEVYSSAEKALGIMNEYVREALFFSEQMAPSLESISLRRVFDEVISITAPRALAAEVRVTSKIHAVESLRADNVLIMRMLVNLVTNAVDASPRNGVVTLEATVRDTGWIRLQVSDNGRGIAPEHIDRIFDPYFTTKDHGETLRGFGLGLTITQKIVNLHGGKISIQSKPGEGSNISIDFPPATEDAPEISNKAPAHLCC